MSEHEFFPDGIYNCNIPTIEDVFRNRLLNILYSVNLILTDF